MTRELLSATAALALLAGLSPASNATLMISANINGTTVTCSDNQASCDTNSAIGQLQVANQTVNGVQFIGSSQTQVIGPTNSLNSSSFQFINNNAFPVSLQLAVSGTNYTGPVTTFSASGSGTFQSAIGSSAALTYFADNANTQGANNATDLPGTLLATDNKSALLTTDSFSFDHSGTFIDPDLYSMALGTNITLTAGGEVVGRNQAIITQQVAAVSEPSTLAILGVGLIGAGLALRRRHKKQRAERYAIA
jgi:hypothetical protein